MLYHGLCQSLVTGLWWWFWVPLFQSYTCVVYYTVRKHQERDVSKTAVSAQNRSNFTTDLSSLHILVSFVIFTYQSEGNMRCSTGRWHKLHMPLMSRYIGSSPPPSYHQSAALVCWGNRTRWCLNLLASPLRITAGSDSQGSRLKEVWHLRGTCSLPRFLLFGCEEVWILVVGVCKAKKSQTWEKL